MNLDSQQIMKKLLKKLADENGKYDVDDMWLISHIITMFEALGISIEITDCPDWDKIAHEWEGPL